MDFVKKIVLDQVLKEKADSKKLSINKIADDLGINRNTLRSYFDGSVPRGLTALQKLAQYFDLSLSELLFGREEKHNKELIDGKYEITVRVIKIINDKV